MRCHGVVLTLVVCLLGGAIAARAQIPAPADGWVVLPVDEYRALRARSLPVVRPRQAAPVEATVTRIDYDLRADGDAAVGQAVLAVDVLREGWAQVATPAGLHVRAAAIDGQSVPLINGTPPRVLLTRQGRSLVTLDIALPITEAGGLAAISLPASPAPMTRTRLLLPRDGIELTAGGGFVAYRSEAAGESRWTVLGVPNQPLALAWKRKVDERRTDQPLRLRARVTSLAGLGEEAAQITSAIHIDVVQGLASEVTLSLPAALVVNQVNGATVADWDVSGTSLRVRLLEPVATEAAFVVHSEARVPREGSIDVPLIDVAAAERETGGIAVDVAGGAGEIGDRRVRGLEPIDPSELGDLVTGRESPSMIAFRLRPLAAGEARSLTVAVVRYTPQAVLIANVEEARYRVLAADDGRLLVSAQYAVRNNQRSFLKATLPPGVTLWSAVVAGRPIRPGIAEADAVLLPLEKGRAAVEAPSFVVELLYSQTLASWTDKSRTHLALPALDLPVSRTGLVFYYSPRFRVEALRGVFRVDAYSEPLSDVLRSSSPPTQSASATTRRGAPNLQALIDGFNNEGRRRVVAGSLPVRMTFPEFGPSMFLASELTAEGQAPFVDVLVIRDHGSGIRD
jgi:hypothetical protein